MSEDALSVERLAALSYAELIALDTELHRRLTAVQFEIRRRHLSREGVVNHD